MSLLGDEVSRYLDGKSRISNEMLEELAYNYIKENHIEDYVKTININNKVDTMGQYNYDSCSLSINPEKNYNINRREIRNNAFQLCCSDKKIDLDIRVLHVLFHELTHAKQNFIKNEENNELSSIIKNENILAENNIYAYHDFHDKFIIEYNANMEGYLEIMKLLESNSINLNRIQTLAQYYFLSQYNVEDNKIISPYEWMTYVFGLDYVDTSNLSFDKKILYGLPLGKDKYEDVKQKLKAS